MGRNKYPNLARSSPRYRHSAYESQFIPGFSIRMHATQDNAIANATFNALKRNLATTRRDKKAPHKLRLLATSCEAIDPSKMYVSILKRGLFVSAIRQGLEDTDQHLNPVNVVRLATSLRRSFSESRSVSKQQKVFVPGDVANFGAAIGVVSEGWRGPNFKYPETDAEGNPNLNGLIVNYKKICVEGIQAKRKKVPTTPSISDEILRQTPYLGLVKKKDGGVFTDEEARILSPLIVPVVRDAIPIQSPTIFLRSSPGSRHPRELPVDSTEEFVYAAAIPNMLVTNDPEFWVNDPSDEPIDYDYMDRMSA